MNKKVLDKEGTAYLVEKIKENFVAKKDLEPVDELPEIGEPGRIYIIPEKKYINLEMVYANDYQQLIVVHDGTLNPEHHSENAPSSSYTGITNDAVKITVGGLLFSGAQGVGYEDDYEDQHGRMVHGEIYYCDTMASQEFYQIVMENGGTLIGLPVQAEIVEGLFVDEEGGVTPKYTASFNYGEDINNTTIITNNYTQYIYTEENGWEEIGGNNTQYEDMPEPSSDNVGQIIQYTGEDNEELQQGHFYICVEGEEVSGVVTYNWEEINVQDTPAIAPKYIWRGGTSQEDIDLFQAWYDEYLETGVLQTIAYTRDIIAADDYLFPIYFQVTKGTAFWHRIVFGGFSNQANMYILPHAYFITALIRMKEENNKLIVQDIQGVNNIDTDVAVPYTGNPGDQYYKQRHGVLTIDNTSSYTPTANYHPATKKYVDDKVATIKSMEIVMVNELPVTGDTNKIYLVKDMLDLSIKYDKNDDFMLYSVCPNGTVNPDLVETETEESGVTYYALKPNTVNLTVEGYSFGPVTLAGPTTFTATDDNEYTGYAVLTPSMSAEAQQVIADNGYSLEGLNCASDVVKGVFIDNNTGKLSPPFVSSFVWPEEIINTAVGIDAYSEYIYTEESGWERLGTINGIDLSDYATKEYVEEHTTQQVSTMPEPSADNEGQVIQYVGETNENYTTGHFYTVVTEEVSGVTIYVWKEVAVQGENVDASDPEALSDLINEGTIGETTTVYVENFGPNGDYTGYVSIEPTSGTGADYSYLDGNETIYGHMESSIDPETGDTIITYSNIVEGAKIGEVARQANGWSLKTANNTWQLDHRIYEDFQWIIDEWIANSNDSYYVPNFSVDGYQLNYMYKNNQHSGSDYKQYFMQLGKVYNNVYYYYQVYFYTHYNTTEVYDETSGNYKAYKYGYYTQSYLTSHQSLSNYLAKNNTTSFTPTGDYNPATKKYVDDAKLALEAEIEEASIQVDTMPEPSSTNVGEVYQYTGPDTQDLDHGHFYEIVEVEVSGVTTYEYQDIGITVGVTTAVAPQEITDITYGAYRRYPGYSDTGLQLLQNNNGQLIWGQTVNSIWIGTQQEYDDLPEHFDTMIYFIKEDE